MNTNERSYSALPRSGCSAQNRTGGLFPLISGGSKGKHTNFHHYDLSLCLRYPVGGRLVWCNARGHHPRLQRKASETKAAEQEDVEEEGEEEEEEDEEGEDEEQKEDEHDKK